MLKPIASALAITFAGAPITVKAYPAIDMATCMKEAIKKNGLQTSTFSYCHCALTLYFDEGRDIEHAIKYCNKKHP